MSYAVTITGPAQDDIRGVVAGHGRYVLRSEGGDALKKLATPFSPRSMTGG
jgi:hypothetical protein